MGYCAVGGKRVGSGMGGRVGQQGEERNAGSRVLGLGGAGDRGGWREGVARERLASGACAQFPSAVHAPGVS